MSGAGLAPARTIALRLRRGLGHVAAVVGLAVIAIARAVVDPARGVDPDLPGTASWRGRSGTALNRAGCPSGCRRCGGSRRGRKRGGCRRRRAGCRPARRRYSGGSGAEGLNTVMSGACAATARAGPSRAIVAGSRDLGGLREDAEGEAQRPKSSRAAGCACRLSRLLPNAIRTAAACPARP